MTLFSTGQKASKAVTLSDALGSDSFKIYSSYGQLVAEIDSKGNIKNKGKVIKIQ